MANWLKQSTAVEVPMGPFLDETDGKTAETGLTITQPDIRLKKNGGAWAQKNAAQTLSHEENGWYEVSLDTTDTNTLGHLVVAIHESGALPVWREFMVVPANVYDSVVSGSDVLDVSTTQFNGSAVTQSGGRPEVNTTHAAGTAWGSGAITAGAFAADAITAAKVAADVGTEIGTAVWATAARTLTANTNLNDLSAAGVRSAVGLASANLDTQLSGIQSDTDNLQTRIPAALVGGRIDASIGAMAANTLTASALATDAVTEIAAGISIPSAATVAEAVLESEIASTDDVSAEGTPTVRRRLRQIWQETI